MSTSARNLSAALLVSLCLAACGTREPPPAAPGGSSPTPEESSEALVARAGELGGPRL